MKPLYGFGLSQEDERTDAAALALPGGEVLSICGAGDMPLSLLALGATRVVAVDVSANQVHLAELKHAAVRGLSRSDAIRFLGFLPASRSERAAWLRTVLPLLPEASRAFWTSHADVATRGAVNEGRYERFVSRMRVLTKPWMGRTFRSLVSCATMEEQSSLFARKLDRPLLRWIFRTAFRPDVYGDNGVESQALRHHDRRDSLGERFFERFRAACTRSPAATNPFLQMHLAGAVRDASSVPEYLSADGFDAVRERASQISFHVADVGEYLKRSEERFDGFQLSNLSDWLSAAEFAQLLRAVVARSRSPARAVWRYLHRRPELDETLPLFVDRERSAILEAADRFPVYSVEAVVIGTS